MTGLPETLDEARRNDSLMTLLNSPWGPPTPFVVLVESKRSLTDLAPPGLDSPMSGVSALMLIPPYLTRSLGLILPESRPSPWPILLFS